MNVLKACGSYVKQLIFTGDVIPTKLFQLLMLCSNVTELRLPLEAELDLGKLKNALQHMQHLEKLEVQLSTNINPLLRIGGLKELTVHVPKQCHSKCVVWVVKWMKNHFIPRNMNLITEMFENVTERRLVKSFLGWNLTPLIGYRSCFKCYYSHSIPLNLFPCLPEFQVEIGETIILPFVKASQFGLFGLDFDLLVLTSSVCDGRLMYRADTGSPSLGKLLHRKNVQFTMVIDTLSNVTEFNFACLFRLRSGHLEQLAIACPNLQQLNLRNNVDCLQSLQGLRAVAYHCHDLRGLNVQGMTNVEMEDHIKMWEIVSNMQLTHIAVDACTLWDTDDKELMKIFRECSTIKAIDVEADMDCSGCEESGIVDWSILSNFSALEYCWLASVDSRVLQEVINGCKKVTTLYCYSYERLIIVPVFTTQLQQLYISSMNTNVPDIFMETISAHGGLVHVVLSLNSLLEGLVI